MIAPPLLLVAALLAPQAAPAPQNESVRIYLDCQAHGCDGDYLRTNIAFVNYVRFREDASVYVLVTGQQNGSGGSTATIFLLGQGVHAGRSDTLTYSSSTTDTDDEVRRGLARTLKIGLMRYVAGTSAASGIDIVWARPDSSQAGARRGRDPWNSWVFQVSANAHFSGESQTSSRFTWMSAEAHRTTEAWKFGIEASYDDSWDRFKYAIDSTTDTTVYSTAHGSQLEGFVIRSLGRHWSMAGALSYSTSTYSNITSQVWFGPALEFDVFPYRDFTRRRFVFIYWIGAAATRYADTTLFGKTRETLGKHQLEISLRFQQPWGNAGISVLGSQYLHDLSKSRMRFSGNIQLRVVRGLSANVSGNYSRIRDQLSLPAGGATPQEVLLQRRQLATNYRYGMSFGLSYTFGSTFNNVVNPRFDVTDGLF